MLDKITRKRILNITKNFVIFDQNLANYTSFRIGGPADAIVFPKTFKEIRDILSEAVDLEIPITILGGGSNTLIKDQGIRGIVMITSDWKMNKKNLKETDTFKVIKVPSGVSTKTVCAFSVRNGLSGMDFATGIPGTIGGAIAVNASTRYGSMHNILRSVTILGKNGKIKKNAACFRKSYLEKSCNSKDKNIILECEINLTQDSHENMRKKIKQLMIKRKNTQPIASASAGCFFKNPEASCMSAGELIDKAGLKGTQFGDAIVSKKHANFIINKGKATSYDVLKLSDSIRKLVYKRFNITLEPEICIIGD